MFGLTSKTEKIYVVDNAINYSNQEALLGFCTDSAFRFGHTASSVSHQSLDRFVSNLTAAELAQTKLDVVFQNIVKENYRRSVQIDRSYINVYFPYTPTAVHTDNYVVDAVTFLIYVNPQWQVDWAGETQFFTDDLTDVKTSILPRGGRAIVFDSNIPHTARTPSVLCPVPRFTLTIKGLLT